MLWSGLGQSEGDKKQTDLSATSSRFVIKNFLYLNIFSVLQLSKYSETECICYTLFKRRMELGISCLHLVRMGL